MANRGGGAVVITGASTGIGRACAEHLDKAGYRVFAGVRKAADGEALRAACSERLTPLVLDVTKPDQIDAAARLVADALGDAPLRGLVNNAGVGVGGPAEYVALDEVRWQFEVNFFGQVAVTQAFMPLLRRGPSRIVNMGSIGGRVSSPFMAPYAASKFALRALTDSQRMELRPFDIWACVVEPGAIRTPMWDKASASTQQIRDKLSEPAVRHYGAVIERFERVLAKQEKAAVPAERVAKAVAHALGSRRPKTHYLVGPDAHFAALLRWALPQRAFEWVVEKAMGLR